MQPCSQPRYGLIERSKLMSGDSLRVMTLRLASTLTLVANGGRSSSDCQPSSKAMRATGSERPGAFDRAARPRPRPRAPPGPGEGEPNSPVGAGLGGTDGRRARDERAMVFT